MAELGAEKRKKGRGRKPSCGWGVLKEVRGQR